MIDVQNALYKSENRHLSGFQMSDYCNKIFKSDYPFLKEVDKFALNNALYGLNNAYYWFFKSKRNHPRYKKKKCSKQSYTTNFTLNNIEVGDGYIKLPKLGKVKAKIHRKADNSWRIKAATITMKYDGKFIVSILYAYSRGEKPKNPTAESTIGLDYKSNGLYVDSNGNYCNMPHYFRQSEQKLSKSQRSLSKKTFGSKNYQKQRIKVAKIKTHVANQRKDYLHKKSTEIANQYDCVCVETLNLKAMANKKFGVGKSTYDNGYAMFIKFLEYKTAERGGYFVKVDKWFPSSQICHVCGEKNKELGNLKIRIWTCLHCNTTLDRDYNAAINIKNEGLRKLKVI